MSPIHPLRLDDPGYPGNLRACPRPPDPLWCRGELDPADVRAIAIVGPRQPSGRGLRQARLLATAFAQEGITVVSGLAAGIDAAAHVGALEAGGRTLAVLGHGLAHPVSPRSNRPLAATIPAAGALLSPFPPETPPTPHTFRARNADIAGLVRAAVVIEPGPTSGTRILARHMAERRRPVLFTRHVDDTDPWFEPFAARLGPPVLDSFDALLRAVEVPPPPTDTQLAF